MIKLLKSLDAKSRIKLLSVFITSLFYPLMAISAVSSPITQIVLTPEPHVVPMHIDNLEKINYVLTAGGYAWAIDEENAMVALYDGNQWNAAQSIPGLEEVSNVIADYPISGVSPGAWAIGQNSDEVISHFDGFSWDPAQSVDSILELKSDGESSLQTSGGYAFLIGKDIASESSNISIYDRESKTWSKPIAISGKLEFERVDSFDDANPAIFLLTKSKSKAMLYYINYKGVVTSYTLEETNYHDADLLGNGKNFFLSYSTADKQIIIAFNPSDNTWKKVISKNYYDGMSSLEGELICKWPFSTNNYLNLSCINMQEQNPHWSPLVSVRYQMLFSEKISMRRDGAWAIVMSYMQDKVFDYDWESNRLIDTHLPAIKSESISDFKGVLPNQLIVCSSDEALNIPRLRYFDNTNNQGWKEILGSSINVKGCDFSMSQFYQAVDPYKNETLWLYKSSD